MIMLFDNVQVIETSLLKKIIAKLRGTTDKKGFNLKDSTKIQDEPLNGPWEEPYKKYWKGL